MIISVASGKGGTGKTTVATNLAVSLGPDTVLLDCDVEEPNSHLFINPVFSESKTIETPVPVIDEKKCTLCGKCREICQFNAIALIGETVLTFDELCHSCGGCVEVCPVNAVTEKGRVIGVIEKGTGKGVDFIHGRLRIGETMSPPLIRKVREHENKTKATIIDAPPGTSCPVIAAMKDADFILLVTEPTPFGLHDLKLAVGAVRILGIPCGLIINKADIGDDKVKSYAKEECVPVLLEIPFSRKIAEAYSRGELIVDCMPGWKKKFMGLYNKIEGMLKQDKIT